MPQSERRAAAGAFKGSFFETAVWRKRLQHVWRPISYTSGCNWAKFCSENEESSFLCVDLWMFIHDGLQRCVSPRRASFNSNCSNGPTSVLNDLNILQLQLLTTLATSCSYSTCTRLSLTPVIFTSHGPSGEGPHSLKSLCATASSDLIYLIFIFTFGNNQI